MVSGTPTKPTLMRLKKISKYTLDKTLRELAQAGYLLRVYYRDKGGSRVLGTVQCCSWEPYTFNEQFIESRLAHYNVEVHSLADKDHQNKGVDSSEPNNPGPRNPGPRNPGPRNLAPKYINKKEEEKKKKKEKSHREQVAVPSDPVDTLMRSHSSGDPRHQKVVPKDPAGIPAAICISFDIVPRTLAPSSLW